MIPSISTREAADFLAGHDRYLILTHIRPDGDTLGCAAALCRFLRQMGRTAYVLSNPQTTPVFTSYLDGLLKPEDFDPETVVTVDVAARNMFPLNGTGYVDRVDLAVDHHASQEYFARRTCVDPDRASCGELLYDILRLLGPIGPEVAVPLYVAVSTDCGCFVYSNTSAACHRVAAELIETGIDVYPLNRRHFRSKSFRRLKIESMVVDGLELLEGGNLAIATLTLDMIAHTQAREEDIEDLSALVGQVEGVRTGATMRELKPGTWKLSLRTDPGDLNASEVCRLLGGGGHAEAAGATMDGVTREEARQKVLDAIAAVRSHSA